MYDVAEGDMFERDVPVLRLLNRQATARKRSNRHSRPTKDRTMAAMNG